MNQYKKTFYKNQAESIIKKMQLRGMDAFYADTKEEANKIAMELIGQGVKKIGYGGSITIDELGLKQKVVEAGHNLINREEMGKTPEGAQECNALLINADTFLMSSNAITLDGELVNIDKRGNRVCFLIYGPKQVIVIAGMNKICASEEDAVLRVRNCATPPNAVRLNQTTPCATYGRCCNCVNNSLCANIVVTRTSATPKRIKVILVGEELGY